LDDRRQTLREIWQIFGKMGFDDNSVYGGESANRSVFIGDLNGGPGWT
jgi:hypothetical protein